MGGHGIAYEARDIEEPARRAELAQLGGGGGAPTFLVEDEVLTGFDPRGILLERARTRLGMR